MFSTLALLAALLIAGVVFYASTRPDTFRVARSTVIAAAPGKIFPLINDLHGFNRWNPFLKLDPDVRIGYLGPDAGKGARHTWEGNGKVGAGSLEIKDSLPPSNIVMALDMLKPMAAQNRVEFTLEPVNTRTPSDTTRVTWAMTGTSTLLSKVMGMCFSMDDMVGKSFEQGLADLKTIAEA